MGIVKANRALLAAALFAATILGVASFAVVRFARGERDEQAWILHTYQVIDALRATLNDAVDLETGQRGYLLTGKPEFLAPYRAGRAKLSSDLAAFQRLTSDNPEQQSRGRALQSILRKREEFLEGGLSVTDGRPQTSPQLIAMLEQGKALMDEARSITALALNEERQLLKLRIAARREVERWEIGSAILLALIALVALMTIGLQLVRNNARLALSEAQRRRQAHILQATLDNIRDGVVVFDESDKVVAFNQLFFRLMDFPETMAEVGATLEQFRSVDVELARHRLDDVPDAAKAGSGFARIARKSRDLDVYRADIRKDGFLIAAQDVTERVHAEITARQAQKMEAIGQLTGGVAHDFNNLLQVVSANLELMVADARLGPEAAERAQKAVAAVERGSRLTAQLLAFARRQPLEPRSLNLGRLVQDMTDLLRRTLGEHIQVECVIGGGLWNTLADPTRVENAVLNLAVNARDAMPEGGKLTIEISNAFLDEDYAAQQPEVMAGQYVMVAVSDTGQGMPPDVAARAFEPFFTTKGEGKGTGLGLSQVYGFVKQSGGHIKIYSEVGEGTTIKIYLPRTTKPEEIVVPVATGPIEGGTETILVVEDDEGVRAAAVDLLTDLGYTVLKAGDAEQALAILGSGARVDLLFTDVVMPGSIPIRELARRAKELCPTIAVLFTSGYTQNAIVHNGKLDDDAMLLSKPYRKDQIARRLRAIFGAKGRTTERSEYVVEPVIAETVVLPPRQGNPDGVTKVDKVLIVEDVPLILMAATDMIAGLGYATAEAADAEAALRTIKDDPSIGIMLTDIGLPGIDGIELARQVRILRPEMRIVIASGFSAGSPELGGDVPNAVYLMKPYRIEQLRQALES